RVIKGRLPLWHWHRQRLDKGLRLLQIAVETAALAAHLDASLAAAAAQGLDDYVLKLMVTRGCGGRAYLPTDAQPQLITIIAPMPENRQARAGVSVHLCREPLPSPVSWAGLKTLNQLSYVLAAQERCDSVYDEGILQTAAGEIIEATARNLFLVRSGTLVTPPLGECGVAGVMRQLIIDKIAPLLAVRLEQKPLFLADVLQADEVFLSNSITGIWPVIRFQDRQWSTGPVTQKIQTAVAHFMAHQPMHDALREV
nr:aminotransferase class IV [Cellvibrionaceae bacterium]